MLSAIDIMKINHAKWFITRFFFRSVDVLLRGDDAAISDDRVELEQIISLCLFSSSSYRIRSLIHRRFYFYTRITFIQSRLILSEELKINSIQFDPVDRN